LVAVFLLTGCRRQLRAQERSPAIRVATGGEDGALVQALSQTLQSYFPSQIQNVQNSLASNAGLVERSQVELAIIPVNVAYLSYTQGWGDLPHPHSKLRGVAVLSTIPLFLVATERSGIRKLGDIRGKRVAVGTPDSTTQVTVRMTLEGLGLSLTDFDAQWLRSDVAVEDLRAGKVDAVFHRGNDPGSTVQKLLKVPGAKVIPILRNESERIRSRHPFLHPISIPAGMYGDHPGIATIGVDSLLVCRDDLPEELVYWITRAISESLTSHPRSTDVLRYIDAGQLHATPIPLHSGAARYYRERELFE